MHRENVRRFGETLDDLIIPQEILQHRFSNQDTILHRLVKLAAGVNGQAEQTFMKLIELFLDQTGVREIVNNQNDNSLTILHLAASTKSNSRILLLETLLNRKDTLKINLHQGDSNGNTAIVYALETHFFGLQSENHEVHMAQQIAVEQFDQIRESSVRMLIAAGCSTNQCERSFAEDKVFRKIVPRPPTVENNQQQLNALQEEIKRLKGQNEALHRLLTAAQTSLVEEKRDKEDEQGSLRRETSPLFF